MEVRCKKNLIDFKRALKTPENKKKLYAKDIEYCAGMFFDLIQEELVEGNEVIFSGFGKFVVRKRQPQKVFNGLKKVEITTNPMPNVHFKCSPKMKKKIN